MRKKLLLLVLLLATLFGCNGENTVSTTPLPPTPPDPPPPQLASFLLAPNNRGNLNGSVDVFFVDTDTGALTVAAGSPFRLDNPLHALAAHPFRPFIYGGVDDLPFLEGLEIDPVTGALTPLPGFPIATVNDNAPTFSETGEFLYVVGENSIDGFQVDQNFGSITRLAGFPQAVPGMTDAIQSAFDNENRFFAVTDRGSDSIFVFAHDSVNGALTLVSQTPSGTSDPLGIAFDPLSQFLYVAEGTGNLQGFELGSTGLLTPIPGATNVVFGPQGAPFQIAIRGGNQLFVGDSVSGNLNAFTLAQDGSLTQIPGYPVGGGGSGVLSYPIPFFGSFLYVSDFIGNTINAFQVDDAGNVNPLPGSPYPTDGGPGFLVPVVFGF